MTLAAIALVAVAVPAQAQAQSASSSTGAVISVQGGGFTSVANLNDADTADFKTGFNVGGSLGYDVNKVVGVRGIFTYARSDSRGTALPVIIKEGTKTDRYLYGGEVVLRAPVAGGISPYLLVGGGAVTFRPDTATSQNHEAGRQGGRRRERGDSNSTSRSLPRAAAGSQFDKFGFDKTVRPDLERGVALKFK
jgi:opacity protein-like surface antigen